MKLRKPSGKAKASPKGLPARSKKKRYTVSLCDHIAGEFVPYKQIDIIATDDNNAIQKADEWVASIPELIEEESACGEHRSDSILWTGRAAALF